MRKGFVTVTGHRINGADVEPLGSYVLQHLASVFQGQRNGQGRRERMDSAKSSDPILARLYERKMVVSDCGGGKFDIICPWSGSHTTTGGKASTAYFLPNTGGYARGHFCCFHSHCSERTDEEFLQAFFSRRKTCLIYSTP